MNKLDNLRSQWQQLDNSAAPRKHGIDINSLSVSQSRRQKLLRQYLIFVVVCLAWVVAGPLFLYAISMPIWMCIICSVFFAVMSATCAVTYSLIRGLNFGRMSVCDLLRQVEKIIKSRLIHKCLGIPLGLLLLGCLLYHFVNNEAVLLGGAVGAILGGAIGFIKDMSIRRALNEIRSELMSV